MCNLSKAKNLLECCNNNCVVYKDGAVYTSKETGIKPLLGFISSGFNLADFSAADKIVGRAAALIFVYLKIKEVYGEVMSLGAIEVFEMHKINYSYGIKVDVIINRAGTGVCPMEEAVRGINDPYDAFCAVSKKLACL